MTNAKNHSDQKAGSKSGGSVQRLFRVHGSPSVKGLGVYRFVIIPITTTPRKTPQKIREQKPNRSAVAANDFRFTSSGWGSGSVPGSGVGSGMSNTTKRGSFRFRLVLDRP